ncbi:GNAT family N-acetyltransferase [Yinghuangia soli]|uniref:GNAT family N-acetyltransferase n=1 Tax=Yinghuangia soli TaxID=2908204 RepID=A0AA41PYA9_9ACTN|nr:GNAT family N-acetyltransferase [Yinghuangia soli]MCF2528154.1 GNAT family N-acetyltransferase [Yinghuangia soli]
MDVSYFCGTLAELSAERLYRLLALRSQVFVVARQRARHEPDGLDIEPATLHVWGERDGVPVATLRLTEEPSGILRLGRLCTAPAERRNGHATTLVEHAVMLAEGRPLIADVFVRSAPWFEQRGFVAMGGRSVVDGEPHLHLRYEPARPAVPPPPQFTPDGQPYVPAWVAL